MKRQVIVFFIVAISAQMLKTSGALANSYFVLQRNDSDEEISKDVADNHIFYLSFLGFVCLIGDLSFTSLIVYYLKTEREREEEESSRSASQVIEAHEHLQ